MTAAPQSGAATTPAGYPTVGTVINGKYLVEKLIGEGGVGIVVAAQNVELGDRVALKFLRKEMLERSDVVGRFMFEAKAACSIKSENVATVFDVGRTPEGVPFLVMEFLEGRDLASIIAESGSLEVRDVAEWGMQTCEALAVAHAKGIVHRDIKPENLFVEVRNGMRSIKVLDFGISKVALTGNFLSSSIPLVKTQNMMGTPLYMSPEQVRSPEQVDPRTDIWSLGVVLYEALTGALPYVADTITELCAAILEQPTTPIVKYRNDLPPDLMRVIERCLEKDMEKRYQNVAEVALDLLPFAPKRARICAERAGEVLVAAGMAEPASVRFNSSFPSALSTGSLPAAASGAYLVAPPPASLPSGLYPTNAAITIAGDPLPDAPPKGGKTKVVAAAAAMVIGLVGIGFVLRTRAETPAPATPPAQAQAIPPPATPEKEPPVAVAEPVTPEPSASASAPLVPVPVRALPPKAKPKPAAVSSTVSSASPEKKADIIDIGY
ncbi:MAG: serine/threonine protein kinase [Labilithrix sp.]|nr:serine/threonine protein kinase [Labilithrix sp.]MCW5818122.1 serine/threonine protein kinase [Labilithrix sp.]